MTETEIYNRTAAAVSEQMHREFGPIHSLPIGQAAALVGLASSLIEESIANYNIKRRRRPWCRVPWQEQAGRRASPDPRAAKRHRSPKWWRWCVDKQRWELATPDEIADVMTEGGNGQ